LDGLLKILVVEEYHDMDHVLELLKILVVLEQYELVEQKSDHILELLKILVVWECHELVDPEKDNEIFFKISTLIRRRIL